MPARGWRGIRVPTVVYYWDGDTRSRHVTEFCDWDGPTEALAFYLEYVKKHYKRAWERRDCWGCFCESFSVGTGAWGDNDPMYGRNLRSFCEYLRGEEEVQHKFNLYC